MRDMTFVVIQKNKSNNVPMMEETEADTKLPNMKSTSAQAILNGLWTDGQEQGRDGSTCSLCHMHSKDIED